MTDRWVRVCLLAVACALGQGTAAALAQATTPPTFPSKVEVITVDAVVVDARGKPVEGLAKDDFVLEEDGQPQDIVSFEAVSMAPEVEAGAKPSEPSPIATNTGAEGRAGRAFAILADDLRLPGEQSQWLRSAIGHFIATSLGPGDAVILGTTSGDAWWSTRFPGGQADLLAVLDHVTGRYVDPSTREHMTEYEAFWITHREAGAPPRLDIGEVNSGTVGNDSSILARVALRLWSEGLCGRQGEHPDIQACWPIVKSAATELDGARSQRVALTLRAMERALGALAPVHGRTSLIFFSPGFLQDDDLSDRGVAMAALRAHTAVYFVDARGLLTDGGLGSASARAESLARQNPGREMQRQFEERNLESSGAQALAEETGGRSFRNTNDLAAAAERITAESRTFYLLGFHPPTGKRADTWRKIRVTVRRDGVTTRARRGYSLPAATAGAFAQPGAQAPIPLRLASYVLDPVAGNRTRVVAVAEIGMSGLASPGAEEDGSSALQLRVEAMPRDGGRTQVQDVSLQMAPGKTREGSESASDWRLARLELSLPAGVHAVRAFLRDPKTGRTGVAEQRIVVPEPSAFRLSTPVLSDQVTASGAAGPASPTPVAHDTFAPRPGGPLLAAFEVFGATRDPATGHGSIESRFVLKDGEGRLLASPPPSPLAASAGGRLQQVIALPPLPGGDYDLSISVRDVLAGSEQEAHRTFRIDGPPGALPRPEPSRSEPVKAISGELAAILDRAGRYVLAYGRDFSNVLAEEECRQAVRADEPVKRVQRHTRGGAFFVTLTGPLPWATFRDIWEVDGSRIRDREERLGRLFQESPGSAAARAKAILEESARYNLGPPRTVNIPTLALLFLHPDNQRRFDYELKGKQSLQGTATIEVAFRERLRPALVAGDTAEGAPAKGRFWIDPERGTVLKTDVTYDVDPRDSDHRSQARIVTEYRPEPKLGILVPDRMKETYEWPAVEAPRLHDFNNPQKEGAVVAVEASTLYSAYRRFQVTTEESFRASPEPKP